MKPLGQFLKAFFMNLPTDFIARIQKDLPAQEAELLLATIQEHKAPVSIRLNPLKKFNHSYNETVAWCSEGRYLPERISFIEDPHWHAGAYYVQEASSMFLSHIIKNIQLPEHTIALDACAAPGGKSTLILSHLSEHSTLIANEIIPNRNTILRENLIRWGQANFIVTQADPSSFKALDDFFDAVFVDAPCSGEGLFRRDPNSMSEWSIANTQLCTTRQTQILEQLHSSIKPGGYLIYSTCTFNPSENFYAPSYLLNEGFENLEFDIKAFPGIIKECQNGVLGYAFRPGNIKGEGFFVSIFKKKGELKPNLTPKVKIAPKPVPERDFLELPFNLYPFKLGGLDFVVPEPTYWVLKSLPQLKITYAGIEAGIVKGKDFIPSHALAYQANISSNIPRLKLDLQQAKVFLKKESLNPRPDLERGLYLVCYEENALGWAKNIGNRINNLLPAEYRIKKAV